MLTVDLADNGVGVSTLRELGPFAKRYAPNMIEHVLNSEFSPFV